MNRRQEIVIKRSHLLGIWIGLAVVAIVMFVGGVVAGTKMCTCPETVIAPAAEAAPAPEARPELKPVEPIAPVEEPAAQPEATPEPAPEPEAKPEPAPEPEPKPEAKPEAKPEPTPEPKAKPAAGIQYSVQVISYLGRPRAETFAKDMGNVGDRKPYIQEAVVNGLRVFRVRIGTFDTKADAEAFRKKVSEKLGKAATVVIYGK